MLGGNVCDTVGEHTVVREASDVWERSPDRQGEAGSECAFTGRSQAHEWPRCGLQGGPGRRPHPAWGPRPSPVRGVTEKTTCTGACQGVGRL